MQTILQRGILQSARVLTDGLDRHASIEKFGKSPISEPSNAHPQSVPGAPRDVTIALASCSLSSKAEHADHNPHTAVCRTYWHRAGSQLPIEITISVQSLDALVDVEIQGNLRNTLFYSLSYQAEFRRKRSPC